MPGRPGRPSLDDVAGGQRQAAIMEVARRLFGRSGYAAVSIGDIARGVGVTRGALYHHFAGKEELFTAVVVDLFQTIERRMRGIVDGPGPAGDRLRQLARAARQGIPDYADMDTLMRDVAENLSTTQREAVEASFAGMNGVFEDLMRQGIAAGEWRDLGARFMAHAFYQLLRSVTGRRGVEGGFTGDADTVERVVDLFCSGVAAHPNERGIQ